MKTTLEIYMEIQEKECPNLNNFTLPEEWQVLSMKEYAKQVAEQALKDAADKLDKELNDFGGLHKIWINVILSTQIVTP